VKAFFVHPFYPHAKPIIHSLPKEGVPNRTVKAGFLLRFIVLQIY
jgi:hypothetical protein